MTRDEEQNRPSEEAKQDCAGLPTRCCSAPEPKRGIGGPLDGAFER